MTDNHHLGGGKIFMFKQFDESLTLHNVTAWSFEVDVV